MLQNDPKCSCRSDLGGLLGCYHGDFEEHWWKVLERDDKGSFSLVNFANDFLIYSNADGRLGTLSP